LSSLISAEIERETLQPYQDRLKNLQQYQQEFLKAVAIEYPLSTQSKSELKDLQDILGLREEDVSSVENKAIPQNQNKKIFEKTQDKPLEKELLVDNSVNVVQEENPSKKKELFGRKNTLRVIVFFGASILSVSGVFIFNRFYIDSSFQVAKPTTILEEKNKEKEEIRILTNNIFSSDTLIRRESTNTLSSDYLGISRGERDYLVTKAMISKYNQDPKNYFGIVNILFLFSKISDDNFEGDLVEIGIIVQSAKTIRVRVTF
jgi:hypothetical protein